MESHDEFKDQKYLKKLQDISEIYLDIAEKAEKFIKKIYKDEEINLPIDLNLIAEDLGIRIVQENLNINGGKSLSRILGRLECENSQTWIKVEATVSYKTQRYAIAHSIARYLLRKTKAGMKAAMQSRSFRKVLRK